MAIRLLALRAALLGLVLAALADLCVPVVGSPPPAVLVLDVSASLGSGLLAPPPGVRVASPWYAVADGVTVAQARQAPPGLPRGATSLGRALALVAERHPGRVVWLVTDGRATDAGGAEAARAIRAAGGRLDVSAPFRPAADVAVLSARAVRRAAGGAEVVATIGASTDGAGAVVLARDGGPVARELLSVRAGSQRRVRLEDPGAPDRAVAYAVGWEPALGTPDDDPGNDELALGLEPDRPAVLLWGDLDPRAFASASAPFLVRRMLGFEAGALDAVDLVVASNLDAERLRPARVQALVRFVAGGGRLLLLGGPRSWGPGGWAGTAVEVELAPLVCPRPEGDRLALVLALDRSGSTASGALDHLVRAARQALVGLRPGERFAVLPFAKEPAEALLAPGWVGAEDRAAVAALDRALGTLVAGGGTDLLRGLEAAAGAVAVRTARTRRVVLLSDGDPDHTLEPESVARLRERLDAAGVEAGALVSGMPQVAELLSRTLARKATDVVLLERTDAIPDRLLEALAEARLADERRPAPSAIRWPAGTDAALGGLAPSWIHALEPAPGSEVLALASWADGGETRPFAARRAVGAGEVIALAWGPAAESDPLSAAERLEGLVARLAAAADRGLAADLEGQEIAVRVPAAAGQGGLELLGGAQPQTLVEVAPGEFHGTLREEEGGLALAVVVPGPGGERRRPLALPARAAPEHRGAGVDGAALTDLARAGGGRVLGPGTEPAPAPHPRGASLAPWLLLLAAILLVVERRAAEARPSAVRSSATEGRS